MRFCWIAHFCDHAACVPIPRLQDLDTMGSNLAAVASGGIILLFVVEKYRRKKSTSADHENRNFRWRFRPATCTPFIKFGRI